MLLCLEVCEPAVVITSDAFFKLSVTNSDDFGDDVDEAEAVAGAAVACGPWFRPS